MFFCILWYCLQLVCVYNFPVVLCNHFFTVLCRKKLCNLDISVYLGVIGVTDEQL